MVNILLKVGAPMFVVGLVMFFIALGVGFYVNIFLGFIFIGLLASIILGLGIVLLVIGGLIEGFS